MRDYPCDILLVTAPPWGVHNPPVGLAYLSTFLRRNNIKCDVFDFNIGLYRGIEPEWHKLWLPEYKNWWSNEERFHHIYEEFYNVIWWGQETILKYDAPIIGFSVVDPKERMTIALIRGLLDEDRDKRIILGGPAVSTPDQRRIFVELLGSSVDYYVVGEGERMLLKLIRKLKMNDHVIPADEEIEKPLIKQDHIECLDAIPFPTYEEFDFNLYDGGGLIVEWSRGCISSCAFCKGKRLLGPFRMKKAETIVAELEHHHTRYGVSHFIVCDNLVNGDPAELERVCDLVTHKGLSVI